MKKFFAHLLLLSALAFVVWLKLRPAQVSATHTGPRTAVLSEGLFHGLAPGLAARSISPNGGTAAATASNPQYPGSFSVRRLGQTRAEPLVSDGHRFDYYDDIVVLDRIGGGEGLTPQDRRALVAFAKYQAAAGHISPGDGAAEVEVDPAVGAARLSRESFESFYASLFDPTADLTSDSRTRTTAENHDSVQPGAGLPVENPFAEAINNLKKEPPPTHPEPIPQAEAGKEEPAPPAVNKPPVAAPPPDNTVQGSDRPVPQPTLGGGVRPFTLVGALDPGGIGRIYPALRLQGMLFEVPRIGTLNLKMSAVAAPALLNRSIIVDDFNGDNLADVAMVEEFDNFVLVWLGLPAGDFTYAGASSTPAGGRSITAGDFNEDGKLDLAVLNSSNARNVDLLFGAGNGFFEYGTTVQFADAVDFLGTSDIDADNKTDLTGTSLLNFRASVLTGTAEKSLFQPANFSFVNLPSAQSISDLNLDGSLDQLLLFQRNQHVSVVLNPPHSIAFRNIANVNLRLPVMLVLGDLLGDGNTDMGVSAAPR